MSHFTRLGCSIWDWEPWVQLPDDSARMFFLGLYTSAPAKRIVPGLWHGSIISMAEAVRMPADRATKCLDILLDHDLAEYDIKARVLRLTQLPDAGEYASNGKAIRGWWGRFRSVPECSVRNAHVRTLRWILEHGARCAGNEAPSHDHEKAWAETFATVPLPAPRRRGVRRLLDNDTSTSNQPGLFPTATEVPTMTYLPEHDPIPSSHPSGASGMGIPDACGQLGPVDNSEKPKSNNSAGPQWVSDTHRIPDPGSRIPESSSSDLREGDRGRGSDACMPRLTLVPTFAPEEVVEMLAQAVGDVAPTHRRQILPESARASLCATIRDLERNGMGLADVALAGKWLAHHTAVFRDMVSVPPDERVAMWASQPGRMAVAIRAQRHRDAEQKETEEHAKAMRELLKKEAPHLA